MVCFIWFKSLEHKGGRGWLIHGIMDVGVKAGKIVHVFLTKLTFFSFFKFKIQFCDEINALTKTNYLFAY